MTFSYIGWAPPTTYLAAVPDLHLLFNLDPVAKDE